MVAVSEIQFPVTQPRYQQLIERVPRGSFYDPHGRILPKRAPTDPSHPDYNPYEFDFVTPTPNRRFGVFVNNVFKGLITTDVDGNAIVELALEAGRNDILLVDEITDSKFRSYVQIRNWATWMAAHATQFDRIDAHIEETRNALSLDFVSGRFIEDVYGKLVAQPNDLDYATSPTYREVLRQLRQSYRLFGARTSGVRQVVQAFTDVAPHIITPEWRDTWFLGSQLAADANADFCRRTRVTGSALTNLNERSRTGVHPLVADNLTANVLPGPFNDPPTPQQLSVHFNVSWAGGSLTVTGFSADGTPLTEVVPTGYGAAPVPVGGAIVDTVNAFAIVSGATKQFSAGAGATASIGVKDSQFVTITNIDNSDTLQRLSGALSYALKYDPTPKTLRWGGFAAGEVVVDPGTQVERVTIQGVLAGTYTVRLNGVNNSVVVTNPEGLEPATLRDDLIDVIETTSPSYTAVPVGADIIEVRRETAFTVAVIGPGFANTNIVLETTQAPVGVFTATNDVAASARRYACTDETYDTQVPTTVGHNRGYINIDQKGPVEVVFTSGIALTASAAADDVNAAISREVTYGGTAGSAELVITAPKAGITLSGSSATPSGFEFADASAPSYPFSKDYQFIWLDGTFVGSPGAKQIPIDLSAAVSPTDVALAAATAITQSGMNVIAFIDPTILVIPGNIGVRIQQTRGGTGFGAPTDAITTLGAGVGFSIAAAFTGQGDSPTHGSSAGAATSQPGDDYLCLKSPAAFEDSVIDVRAGLWDALATDDIFGVPRRRGAVSGALTTTTTTIPLGANEAKKLPTLEGVQVIPQIASSITAVQVPAVALPFATALEVRFSATYDGGNILIKGRDCNDNEVEEIVTAALNGQLVASGIGANTAAAGGSPIFQVGVPGGFPASVKAGMVIEFPALGVRSVIDYVGRDDTSGERELYMRNSISLAPIADQNWNVKDAAVVRGSQLFAQVEKVANASAGTAGDYSVYIYKGLENWSIPVRIGHDYTELISGGTVTITPDTDNPELATVEWTTSTALAPRHFRGALLIVGSETAATPLQDGANDGLHTIVELSPRDLGSLPSPKRIAKIRHQEAGRGYRFQAQSTTGLGVRLYSAGEVQTAVAIDKTADTVTVVGQGLHSTYMTTTDGFYVALANEALLRAQGSRVGNITVAVDSRLAPTATKSDTLGVEGEGVPDEWVLRNGDYATSRGADNRSLFGDCVPAIIAQGVTATAPVCIEHVITRRDLTKYRGLKIRVAFWVQALSEDLDFTVALRTRRGSAFLAGEVTPVPVTFGDLATGAVTDKPTRVPFSLPLTGELFLIDDIADELSIQLCAIPAAPGTQVVFAVEKVLVTADIASPTFLGHNTTPSSTSGLLDEVLYIWSPTALTSAENETIGIVPGGYRPTDTDNHIDRITNAHGFWQRYDISEYTTNGGTPVPVNVRGVHDITESLAPPVGGQLATGGWLSAGTVLTNMEVGTGSPGRLSFVQPARVSLQREVVSFQAPFNRASLNYASTHVGVAIEYPQAAQSTEVFERADDPESPLRDDEGAVTQFLAARTGFDRLYQDREVTVDDDGNILAVSSVGLPVPATAFPRTHGTTTLGGTFGGPGNPDAQVIVTVDAPGIVGDNWTVDVFAGIGVNLPLQVSGPPNTTGPTKIVVVLGTDASGVLDDSKNRAAYVLELINDIVEGVTATFPVISLVPPDSGDGSGPLVAGDVGTALFSLSAPTPWRFFDKETIEIASAGAGDPADFRFWRDEFGDPSSIPYFDTTATYSVDYAVRIQAVSGVIDLGDNHTDYVWLADAAIYRRVEASLVPEATTEGLSFLNDFRAELSEVSNQDKNGAVLVRDDGLTRTEIPAIDWDFINGSTIRIEGSQFVEDANYTFSYSALRPDYQRVPRVIIEFRELEGPTPPVDDEADWVEYAVGDVLPSANTQYFQARVRCENVLDIRDVRIFSLGAKGIHLYGANPHAPGLLSCDENL